MRLRKRSPGRAFALAALGCVAAVLAPPAAAAEGAGERLTALLAQTRTLHAAFLQTVYDERHRPVEHSKGVLYIMRPGRFRWEYREPLRQVIVADGERVWVHDEELDQVTVRPLDDAIGDTPALLLTNPGALAERFHIRPHAASQGLEWIELVPKDPEATFERVRVGLSGEAIERMEMADNFGQLTELRFLDAKRNLPLAPELFRFEPPPGADVIREQ